MADVIVVVYLSGWFIASVALAVLSRVLTRRFARPRGRLAVSILAGAAWLLLLVGAAQFGALMALSRVLSDVDDESADGATTVDERANHSLVQ
jgi:O-antigen ligase